MIDHILSPQVGLLFFQTIIMICVAWILKKYAWKPILALIKREETAYIQAHQDMKTAHITSEKLKKESNEIIKQAEKKKQLIIDNALITQKKVIAQAHKEAAEEQQRMLASAQKTITAKEKASFLKIKKQAAMLVISVTQKLLKLELDKQNIQEAVLHRFIEEAAQERPSQAI